MMYRSLAISYWVTLALAIPAAGFFVRLFIIFHDCGHGSFFRSRKANDALGVIIGFLVFTPYYPWRHKHASRPGWPCRGGSRTAPFFVLFQPLPRCYS
jgi:omega-6 fatty acid desaturase (delta-12 desaturase)